MAGTAELAQAFAWHLGTSEIVGATSSQSRPATRIEQIIDKTWFSGTYQPAPQFVASATTALPEKSIVPSSDRPEDAIIAEIRAYTNLTDGWDGETAAKPDLRSIENASNFIRLLGGDALMLEPTLHANGTVILETENGDALRFLNNGEISAVLSGFAGLVRFDGTSIPHEIATSLDA